MSNTSPVFVVTSDVEARLARLCDRRHPQEVGGYLLGTVDVNYSAVDVFPVPNISGERGKYLAPSFGKAWASLYAETTGLTPIARFHSHPNGTVVSEQDMRACGSGVHVWVVHHGFNEHTYTAAENLRHLNVLIQPPQSGMRAVILTGDRLNLGEVWLNRSGEFEAAPTASHLLSLDGRSRRAYMAAILAPKEPGTGFITYTTLARILRANPGTVRDWMRPCIKQGLVQGRHGGIRVNPQIR
jgi:proteasome lid subunit RPN8/RPN11